MNYHSKHLALDKLTISSDFCKKLDGKIECLACAHKCLLHNHQRGICGVRTNRDGELLVPHGYISSMGIDPIEKKPLFHFMPGETTFSFGMFGCNFKCSFCQNWQISQTFHDCNASASAQTCTPHELIATAESHGATIVACTYNEPFITIEWVLEIFKIAKERGLKTCLVSNGFASAEALQLIAPWLDAINIDLKCFKENSYHQLGGRLKPVMKAIEYAWCNDIWVEVTTLVVPEFNDDCCELRDIARFIASVSKDIPWHVSAWHSAYKYKSTINMTPDKDLLTAVKIGKDAGLKYIYCGNSSTIKNGANTICNNCKNQIITRDGFKIIEKQVKNGRCSTCGDSLDGVFL